MGFDGKDYGLCRTLIGESNSLLLDSISECRNYLSMFSTIPMAAGGWREGHSASDEDDKSSVPEQFSERVERSNGGPLLR